MHQVPKRGRNGSASDSPSQAGKRPREQGHCTPIVFSYDTYALNNRTPKISESCSASALPLSDALDCFLPFLARLAEPHAITSCSYQLCILTCIPAAPCPGGYRVPASQVHSHSNYSYSYDFQYPLYYPVNSKVGKVSKCCVLIGRSAVPNKRGSSADGVSVTVMIGAHRHVRF